MQGQLHALGQLSPQPSPPQPSPQGAAAARLHKPQGTHQSAPAQECPLPGRVARASHARSRASSAATCPWTFGTVSPCWGLRGLLWRVRRCDPGPPPAFSAASASGAYGEAGAHLQLAARAMVPGGLLLPPGQAPLRNHSRTSAVWLSSPSPSVLPPHPRPVTPPSPPRFLEAAVQWP